MKLLKELSEACAVPGNEEEIRKIIKRELRGKTDSLKEDVMGNLIAIKKSSKKNAKKVMLSCHMDEIGFYVTHVDKQGFLRVKNVGGFDTRNLFARQVHVHTSSGVILGLMNPKGKPVHIASPAERKKIPEIAELCIDIGLSGKEAEKKVKVGDMVTLKQEFQKIGKDNYTGKALDNRVAVWLGINIIKKIKNPNYDICCAFTVQEEVGLRGAVTASYSIEPDFAIAIDTTLACDTPGVPEEFYVTKLGGGVGIKVLDGGSISDRRLVDEFVGIAKKKKINHQMEILPAGATDAGGIQRSRVGVKTITLSVPTRYIHTVTECINKKDLDATYSLLEAYLGA